MKVRNKLLLFFTTAQLTLLTACASVPEAPLRGVTSLTDHVSEAGQEFTLAFMPDADMVSVQVIWPNDWAHNSDMPVLGNLGVELMSSGGAGSRSASEIKQVITALGSAASIVTTPDHVYGSFTATVETLDETISIVRDVITEPELDALSFDVLKEAKQKRVEAQQENPSAVLWSATRQVLLGDSTLTDYWNNTPVEQVVAPLTAEDVKRWHRETFTSADVRVAIAGTIEADRAGKTIDDLLGALPVNSDNATREPPALNTGITVLLHDESATSTHMAVVGLLPASREGGEIADIVAVSALGKGKESRLHKAKADELAESVSVDASIANFSREVRVFGINANADSGKAEATFKSIQEAYRAFLEGDLEDQEVLRSVVPFVNSLRSNDKKVDLLAYGLGQLLLDDLPKEMLLSVTQDSLSLKAADINQRITDHYPEWEDMVKVIVSDNADVIEADCIVTRIEELAQCQI